MEETAKLAVVVAGLALHPAELAGARRCCPGVLLESPGALTLAGLAVGFGFMVAENAAYFLLAAAEPSWTRWTFGFGILWRTLCNAHAIFTGLVALRLARAAEAVGGFRAPEAGETSALRRLGAANLYTTLYYSILYCSTAYYTVPLCTTLCYCVLYCTVLYYCVPPEHRAPSGQPEHRSNRATQR